MANKQKNWVMLSLFNIMQGNKRNKPELDHLMGVQQTHLKPETTILACFTNQLHRLQYIENVGASATIAQWVVH